jgi:hypothetical protein
MSQVEFFRLVEQDLRLRHVPFNAGELRTFLADVGPLVEDLPAVWADRFLASTAARSPA